jgi:hypothetical protein
MAVRIFKILSLLKYTMKIISYIAVVTNSFNWNIFKLFSIVVML